jgi:hypothetical protein
MDSKELRGIMEAYSQMYAPQEDTEQLDEISANLALTASQKADEERRKAAVSGDKATAIKKAAQASRLYRGVGSRRTRERMGGMKEEVDVYDVVLEFLQAEGFAETLEEAEWLMANQLNAEDINAIVEAMGEEDDEEDEKEMKKGKKSKKSEEDDEDEEDEEDEEELEEASYSAKAARAGKDIGKPGKAFAKIAKSAAKRYGSKERGEKVAGAVLAKLRAKRG